MTGSWRDLWQPRTPRADLHARRLPGGHRRWRNLRQRLRPQHHRLRRSSKKSKQLLIGQKPQLRGYSTDTITNMVSGSAVDPPHLERRHRERPQPGEEPGELQVRDGEGGRAASAPTRSRSPPTPSTRAPRCCSSTGCSSPRTRRRTSSTSAIRCRTRAATRTFSGLVKDEPSINVTVDRSRTRASSSTANLDAPGRRAWDARLDRGEGGLGARRWRRATASAARFLLPGGLWLLAAVRGAARDRPGDLVRHHRRARRRGLRLVPGELLARRSTRCSRPVLLRSVGYALATVAAVPADRLPGGLHIARYGGRRKNLLIALDRAAVLRQLPRAHVRLGRDARPTRARQRRSSRQRRQRADPLPQHAVRGDRRPRLRLPGVHDPAGLRGARSHGPGADRGRQGPLRTRAARRSGTSPGRTTFQGVLAGTVLVFLPAVGDFVSAQLLGGPDTYMVGNLIQQQFFGARTGRSARR